MQIPHSILSNGDNQTVTVFIPGGDVLVGSSDSTPQFKEIVRQLVENGGEVEDVQAFADLFDTSAAVQRAFQRLSERVHVDGGVVFFDGDPIHSTLTDQIVRFLDEGEDPALLVMLWENIALNPSPRSVEQLYDWLQAREGVSVTEDGMIVGYKGVESDGNGGYRSLSSGTAFVNDEKHTGKIPNAIGDVVSMPRGEVVDDPNAACHQGLHVGTYEFAKGYSANGVMLRVLVNPRDVVSVPFDARGEKIRVCRYFVDDIIEDKDAGAVYRGVQDEVDEEAVFAAGDEVKVADTHSDYYGEYGEVTYVYSDGSVEVFFESGYAAAGFAVDQLELI